LILVDLLEPELADLNPKNRKRRYDDHYHVNTIIGRTIDSVQDQVLEALAPNLDLVDKILRPIDEWLISELITNWREEL